MLRAMIRRLARWRATEVRRIIEWANGEGVGVLDFGRSTPAEGTFSLQTTVRGVASPLFCGVQARDLGKRFRIRAEESRKYAATVAVWKRLTVGDGGRDWTEHRTTHSVAFEDKYNFVIAPSVSSAQEGRRRESHSKIRAFSVGKRVRGARWQTGLGIAVRTLGN
jgi:hypothetical protein